jgi:hypothetical protein
MPDQLFTYYIENPIMIISINSGSWGGNGYQASYKFWGIGKGGIKKGRVGKEMGGWGKMFGAAEFCGSCVHLGLFLLLWWRVLVSEYAGGWGCVQLYSRLVSRW